MTTTLSKSDFKIVYFHLPKQDEEEEQPKGCVVVHIPTGLAGIGEKETVTVKENLIQAFNFIASKSKIPLDEVNLLFSCPTCHQERLPIFENWKSSHDYEYRRDFTGNDHSECSESVKFSDTTLCTALVYKNEEDLYWYWRVDEESEEPLGFAHFPEDAIEAAEKYALEVVKKSVFADELDPRE